ncbi:F-box protein, partial [Trifolium medium]|nr:F-box protein [Trifolium medium]
LIKPPPQQQQTLPLRSWLIRTSQNSTGKTQLLHPLFPTYSPLPFPFHHVIDFNKFSTLHLGTNFTFTIDNQSYGDDYIYPLKVVTTTSHGEKPLVLGKLDPRFVLFKCGDENWKVIPDMQTNLNDICLYKGQLYAVDDSGRTIRVGPDNSSVQLVAEPLVDGDGFVKLLVESEGDLLLADIHAHFYIGFPCHDPGAIDLFKLNEKEKKWVKLTSLGDRVLFLGECCSFTVSASDLCGSKGNCVILLDYLIQSLPTMPLETCILHLDEGRISLLSDDPEYSNLFWPPPEWIVKSC